jgi:hypothetical protein
MEIPIEMEHFNFNTAYLNPPSSDTHDVFMIFLKFKLIFLFSTDATKASNFDILSFV